jgi:hypothetical protein
MNCELREVRTSHLVKPSSIKEHRDEENQTYNQRSGALSRRPGSCIVSYSGNKEYPTNFVITRSDSLAFPNDTNFKVPALHLSQNKSFKLHS